MRRRRLLLLAIEEPDAEGEPPSSLEELLQRVGAPGPGRVRFVTDEEWEAFEALLALARAWDEETRRERLRGL